jgi:chemotaxis receptor (MCP) glutamine deamidase CheD
MNTPQLSPTPLQNEARSMPASAISPCSDQRCQILVKKGFLKAQNITSGLVLLAYSKEFKLGVLLHLPSANDDSSRQAFAQSAVPMILSEFEALGVARSELVTYVVGGSATDSAPSISKLAAKRLLWNYGLLLSACDLGGHQIRSVWMDVESGRTIVRSESLLPDGSAVEAPVFLAS